MTAAAATGESTDMLLNSILQQSEARLLDDVGLSLDDTGQYNKSIQKKRNDDASSPSFSSVTE